LPFNFSGEAMKMFILGGAVFCFLGVLSGALGAHALKDYLIKSNGLTNYSLATDYMFYHGMALFCVAFAQDRYPKIPFNLAGWLFIAGTLLFQGNLYLMSLTGMRMLQMLTPIGGLCLMAGWLLFALQALRIPKSKG
jgi:uncharacterized membrane protein YgdD (TMEM256/DUF423 family)